MKFRFLKDQTIPDRLADDVSPGRYRLYEPSEIPSYLASQNNPRGKYANTCSLVLATTWNSSFDLFGYKPSGDLYYISTFRDDLDRTERQEFNKDVQLIFRDIGGSACTIHLYDPNEHSISAVATGTGLRFLKQTFRLPDAKSGRIDELIKHNTSIWPYPTDPSQNSYSE
jgi:hypothetical protein